MTEQNNSQQGIRFLVIAAALVIIIVGINQALVSFLVAVFFAIIGTPPVLWLERKRIPSVVAVLLVVAGMITILLIVGAIVGASTALRTDSVLKVEEKSKVIKIRFLFLQMFKLC